MNTEQISRDFFFGKYLIDKHLVTEEDVIECLDYQRTHTLSFEKVAVELNKLTMKRVFQVLLYQADTGLSFKEVALKRGMLVRSQVEAIEGYIESHKPLIGETLVRLGKVSAGGIERESDEYEKSILNRNNLNRY